MEAGKVKRSCKGRAKGLSPCIHKSNSTFVYILNIVKICLKKQLHSLKKILKQQQQQSHLGAGRGEVGKVFFYTSHTSTPLFSSPQSPPWETEQPSPLSPHICVLQLPEIQLKLFPSKKYSVNTIIHSKNNKIPSVAITSIFHF